ncbi:MAG: ABC transporter ATP-binding protein [Flavobacteriales bacterium]|nr:ABC transporter ATP-binding protein [Flavobacteriales bacterium]
MSDTATASGKAFDLGLFRRVLGFVRPYRGRFLFAFALTILLAGVGVVRPMLMGRMIDDHALRGDGAGLLFLTWVVAALLLIEAALQFLQTYTTSWLGQAVTFDLRDRLFRKIVQFRMRYFDRTPIGTLVTRVISDIGTIDDIFSQGLLEIMGDILKLVVVVVVMFVLNWKMALLCLLPIPLLLWATNIFKNSIRKSFQDVRTAVARLNAFVQEHIQGMVIVQAFGREEEEGRRFAAINKAHRGAHIRSVFAYSVFFPVVEILSAISLSLLVWWGMKDVLVGEASFGDLFAFILYIGMLYRPIRQLADRFNVLQMGMVGSERVFKVLDTEAAIADAGRERLTSLRGDIEVEDLWFAYEDDHFVLKGISFQAKAGQMVALVGATGSGKTSIVNVLSRAYEFQKGNVRIDDKDIRDVKLDDLRHSVSVVPQDVFLFSDTVHNNITLGDPQIGRERVIQAAREVGAASFIERLPLGFDTVLGERGSTLSTGQRQLLAFIRAAVQAPRILVLDEATSSVDSVSEQLIQQATERLTRGRTSLVIAHRLSTVQHADLILVLDQGLIIEQGSHQELLEKGGAYRRLYDLQFR